MNEADFVKQSWNKTILYESLHLVIMAHIYHIWLDRCITIMAKS
jgi:hypothetical protein